MSERIRCPACKGLKKVFKLGSIEGNCDECRGVGSIAFLPPIETVDWVPNLPPREPVKETKSDGKKAKSKE